MKKLTFIITLSSITVFGACDLLEDQQPQQELLADGVLVSEEGIRNIVVGVYDSFQDSDLAGANYVLVPDVMAGDAVWVGSFASYQDIRNFLIRPNNGEVTQLWTNSYRTINNINIVLEALGSIDDPGFTDNERAEIQGQMLAIRGIIYFEMTRRFGKPWIADLPTDPNEDLGVAIRLTPTRSSEDFANLERSTVADCYNQAISDLTLAVPLLSSDEDLSNSGEINKAAAEAYLMKIAVQQGDYTQAAQLSGSILEDYDYSLEGNIEDIYTLPNSTEVIHRIIQINQDNNGVNGSLTTFYSSPAAGGRGDVNLSLGYLSALESIISSRMTTDLAAEGFSAIDDRASKLLTGLSSSDFSTKYPSGATNDDDTYLTRLAEVMLTRAESLARTSADLPSVSEEVYELLNQVRTRSISIVDRDGAVQSNEIIEYVSSDFTNLQELIDAIILERRIELAFEGDRLHTLTRIGGKISGTTSPTSNNVIFPIPQVELDANSNIQQNPGY